MRDWDAWSDGLEVNSCHRRHGRQLSVEWVRARPAELGQQEAYSRSRSDSGEHGSATREPCWSG